MFLAMRMVLVVVLVLVAVMMRSFVVLSVPNIE